MFRSRPVTDLPGPPLEQTNCEKIDALKRCTQEIARDLRSCDDVQISYLETLEERDNDNLRLAQMLAVMIPAATIRTLTFFFSFCSLITSPPYLPP
jgi:hypothetical protein